MKIWLIGSSGLLGKNICRLLLKEKYDYCITSSQEVDISSFFQVESFFIKEKNITHIINCAAYTFVDEAEKEKEKAFLVNAIGPKNLGIISRKYDVKIIHFSTDYVFDGEKKDLYLEEDFCLPCNIYGVTKHEGEKALLTYGKKILIIRTSWLFGSLGEGFVSKMIDLMKNKSKIKVINDQYGLPSSCKDLAEVALKIISYEGIFHFANSGMTTWYLFANRIYEEAINLGFLLNCNEIIPVTTDAFSSIAKRPYYSVLNTEKIENILCEKIRPWKEPLKEVLENLRIYEEKKNCF